jgi:hypothetical protein
VWQRPNQLLHLTGPASRRFEVYWLSSRPGPGNPLFEGLMDELVIYNRDLTAEELQELIKK